MIDTSEIKQIPIIQYLLDIGHPYHVNTAHTRAYACAAIVRPGADNPRNLSIDIRANLWHDLVSGDGGSIIDLVMRHRNIDYLTAIRYLNENYNGGEERVNAPQTLLTPSSLPNDSVSGVNVIKVEPLHRAMWIDYLQSRGISKNYASPYISEVTFLVGSSAHPYYGLGWQSIAGVWHIRTKMTEPNKAKYSQAPATMSVYPGIHPDRYCIFEGILDYLSFLVLSNATSINPTTIVLNSVEHRHQAIQWLQAQPSIGEIRLYLDNDVAGNTATNDFKAAFPSTTVDCRCNYLKYNDLNDFLKSVKKT